MVTIEGNDRSAKPPPVSRIRLGMWMLTAVLVMTSCGGDEDSVADGPQRPLGTDFAPTMAGFCDEMAFIVGEPAPGDRDEVSRDAAAIADAITDHFDSLGPGFRVEFAVAVRAVGNAAAALATAASTGDNRTVGGAGRDLLDAVEELESVAVEYELNSCAPETFGQAVAERAIELGDEGA